MELELYLQIAIPSGYLGYLISRGGVGEKDKSHTVVFISLIFALISVLAWNVSPSIWTNPYFQILSTISTPILFAIVWRKWLGQKVFDILHSARILNATQFPTVWVEMSENTNVGTTQISVFLKNGQILSCDFTPDFDEAPLENFRWDDEGNIALYVTRVKGPKDKTFKKVKDPVKEKKEEITFYRLTYIPSKEIEKVEVVNNKITS